MILYSSNLRSGGCALYLPSRIAEIQFVGFIFLHGFRIISRRREKTLICITLFVSEVLKNGLLK